MNGVKKFIATTDMNLLGRHVAIVGGGIGGMTAALAFAKQGASVCVYEQAAALAEVGAGIQITPNAGRVLKVLGVWDALLARGVQALAVVPRDALSGRVISRFLLTNICPEYLFLHRADLISVLAEALRASGGEVLLGQRGLPPAHKFDLVVAAEGIKSETREILNGPSDPFFTGQVAWRAVVPGAGVAEAQIWMAPGRHVVTYPLSGDRLNVVAVQERDDWAIEGWNYLDDPKNMRLAFADTALELQDILSRVDQVHLWGLFRHPVAKRWVTDKVALIGDAAHPTLPFLAQGANLAIEDAFVVARCCAEDGIKTGLQRFESLRKPRVIRAIAAANANARNYHLDGVQRRVAHLGLKVLGTVAPNAFINRLSWLYNHDVTI